MTITTFKDEGNQAIRLDNGNLEWIIKG